MSARSQSQFLTSKCTAAGAAGANASTAQTTVTWFHDPPSRGAWNMALDDVILYRAAGGGPPVLRFYQWYEPTLSLGYFQSYGDRACHPASIQCAVVRRATGGGAILHDRELTYSCTLPPGHFLGRRAGDLYDAIHNAIVDVLADCGPPVQLFAPFTDPSRTLLRQSNRTFGCGANDNAPAATNRCAATVERFLCFERRTPGDVLFDGWKIAGSAQRRHRGAVLQHGSILLERSPFAPELPGIRDLSGRKLEIGDLVQRLRHALSIRLGFDFIAEPPSAAIKDEAAAIEAAKFAADHWLRLR